MDRTKSIKGMKNIGGTIARKLDTVGVKTLEDIEKVGPVNIYKKLVRKYPDQTLPKCYYLYSLQAAIMGIDWRELPKEIKRELLKELEN